MKRSNDRANRRRSLHFHWQVWKKYLKMCGTVPARHGESSREMNQGQIKDIEFCEKRRRNPPLDTQRPKECPGRSLLIECNGSA
ncbi:unnamed protein product, partial [Mesorhabditis spiculigera]